MLPSHHRLHPRAGPGGQRASSGAFTCWNVATVAASSLLMFLAGYYLGFYVLLDVDANKQWTSEDRVAQSSLSHVPSFQAPSAPSPPDPLATNLQHATQVAEQLARARGVLPKQQLVETAAVPSAPALLQPQSMCSDSCAKAKNGICEDGRLGQPSKGLAVECDLGTDCSDCGPWFGYPVPPVDADMAAPVSYLKGKGVHVRSTLTLTRPAMRFAYTDPSLDVDVSELLERTGILEGGITQVFHEALRDKCIRPDGSRALVVDVGANFGYFSVYAALHGCRVVAWEPVPIFRAFTYLNLALNNVSHLVTVRGTVAGEEDGKELEMHFQSAGNWGTASVDGMNQGSVFGVTKVKVPSERIDSAVKEDVLLAKVDVEGYEPIVFRSLYGLITRHKVDNIIMEYNPGTAERLFPDRDILEENPMMLLTMILKGYRVMQLDDNYGKGGSVNWETGIPQLPEVTAEALKYDIEDCKLFKKQLLGCPKPTEVETAPGMDAWRICNQMPEDAHPKSFRSMYPMNTNVWAVHPESHLRQFVTRSEIATIFSLEQDSKHTWESTKGPKDFGVLGIGSRVCHFLPPKMLVRSRCNCTHAEGKDGADACRAEEKLVAQLVKEGKMPWRDV